jgi:hypothetical protein
LTGRFERIDSAIRAEPDDLIHRDSLASSSPGGTCDSFGLSTSHSVISSVVLGDNRNVQGFLGEAHSAKEIARLAGDGIHLEGRRCLGGPLESEAGRLLCEELIQCHDIPSLLRICAAFYTRNTFLYRRVNRFLRSSEESESDRETGRNLGLYIGLLRECFCVRDGPSPVSWASPGVVYRGANFSLDIVADYVRGGGEIIRWQGFASASRDRGEALGFPGTVLFEILVGGAVASVDDVSAFKHEQEIILTPYHSFSLKGVRWDGDSRRWILSVSEDAGSWTVPSWFPKASPKST